MYRDTRTLNGNHHLNGRDNQCLIVSTDGLSVMLPPAARMAGNMIHFLPLEGCCITLDTPDSHTRIDSDGVEHVEFEITGQTIRTCFSNGQKYYITGIPVPKPKPRGRPRKNADLQLT